MHITELGLTAATLAALEATSIATVEQLTVYPGGELLPQDARIGPFELYEIVCQLNQHGLSLPPVPSGAIRVPSSRHREILRLRIIEGLPLDAIGQQTGIKRERVRQLLAYYFGLRGKPPAVRVRRAKPPT